MSFWSQSLIDFRNLKPADVFSLFDKATQLLPNQSHNSININTDARKNACLLFLEPSTRTQLSFDLACKDLGMNTSTFIPENSSLKKGETLLDTLLTLQAMQFDLFVIRHGHKDESLLELKNKINVPIINAGEGVSGHPTQALLDLFTISEVQKNLKEVKVLFVGDIKHSRVVSSNVQLLDIMGIEYAFCGPKEFMPQNTKRYFENLEEGMAWSTVTMALRNQLERHSDFNIECMKDYNKTNFVEKYCITKTRLNNCKKDVMIMHPGPFNRDIEIASDILDDNRVYIFKQVENGRKIRRAIMHFMMTN